MLFNPDAAAAAAARKSRRDGAQRPSKRGVRAVQTVCLDGSYQCRSRPTHNRLIINHLPICRLLACKRRSFTTQKAAFCTPKDGLLGSSAILLDDIQVLFTKTSYCNPCGGNVFWRICNPPKSTIRICNPLKPHSHEINVWACADCKSAIRNRRIANPAEQMLSLIYLIFHPTDWRMTRKRRGYTWPDVRQPSAT